MFVPSCRDKYIFSKKTRVLPFGHALTQNSWICPIMSYLWMIGLVMRLFACGANLWRSPARIQPKKGPAPWILFLTPAPRPLQVTVSMLVKLNISICTLLQGQMYLKQKKTCFAIWERIDTICLNLLLMSDLCKFSIIIIISPFPKNKILVPNLVKSCKEPYPLKQSWVIFFLGSNGRMDAACANRWFQNY